jgi:hypothetical protein
MRFAQFALILEQMEQNPKKKRRFLVKISRFQLKPKVENAN